MSEAGNGLHLVELYSRHLAINGDMGNTIVLAERGRLAGLAVRVTRYNPGDELPNEVDLVTIGSGPASAVRAIADDVMRLAPTVRQWVEASVPLLAVGAGYQLCGRTVSGITQGDLSGFAIFDAVTDASVPRVVTHNFVVETELGRLVGIENHGSTTTLATGQKAFGRVVTGKGNGDRGTEGAESSEAIGTHLHGPVLAMNPVLADHMLSVAAARRGAEYRTTSEHSRLDALAAATRELLDRATVRPVSQVPTHGQSV
ncbi:MAG: type 1 glutamine amidotransferase [Lacisediminihabitans sp.]